MEGTFSQQLLMALVSVVIVQLVTLTNGLPTGSGQGSCKCVPDQWRGLLSSVERHYDLQGGNTAVSENQMYINYDYTNRLFVMEDLSSGNVAIADYKKGYKYLIRGEHCRAIKTDEKMTKMCLPDSSEAKGEFVLGKDSPVEIWEFEGPMNMNMRTTVFKDTCMPVAEDVAMNNQEFATLTSSMYFNVQFGAEKKKIPPENCVYSTLDEVKRDVDTNQQMKRMLNGFQT